jgi:hypothetical protein
MALVVVNRHVGARSRSIFGEDEVQDEVAG